MAHTVTVSDCGTGAYNAAHSYTSFQNSRPYWAQATTSYVYSYNDFFMMENYWVLSDALTDDPTSFGMDSCYALQSDAQVPPKYGLVAVNGATAGDPVLAALEEANSITGAGTSAVNSRFVFADISNSKAAFINESEDHHAEYNSGAGKWHIRTGSTLGGGTLLYSVTDSGDTFPTSGWTVDGGGSPAPSGFTVEALTASDGTGGDEGLVIGAKENEDTVNADLTGISFKSDGTKIYGSKRTSTATIYEYAVSSAWDASTVAASATSSLNVSGELSSVNDVTFSADGTKVYAVATTTYRYSLSTPWDLSTAGATDQNKSWSGLDTAVGIGGMVFNGDGTKAFLVSNQNDKVYQVTLSTGFDLSTAGGADSSISITQDSLPRGLCVSSDGKILFVVGETTDDLYWYRMSTPWDLSTATYEDTKDISGTVVEPNGLYIGNSDADLYVAGETAGKVFQYPVQSLSWESTGDETAPTVSSITLAANGTTVTVVFDEAVTQGSGYDDGDWTLNATDGDTTMTYSSGDGTDTHVFTAGRTIESSANETVTADWAGTADGLEDAAGNDLASFSSTAVTNNSTQTGVAPVLTSAGYSTVGSTTADGDVTTNEDNGTLYGVVTVSGTAPSAAQVKAGQDNSGSAATFDDSQAISSVGAKQFNATGLTESTSYYWHFMHEDEDTNQSSVVSSGQFTTTSGFVPFPISGRRGLRGGMQALSGGLA